MNRVRDDPFGPYRGVDPVLRGDHEAGGQTADEVSAIFVQAGKDKRSYIGNLRVISGIKYSVLSSVIVYHGGKSIILNIMTGDPPPLFASRF
ncbi:MAG: hypothetical protein LBT14_11940 [Treponema sp.]|jgi:hypothetical protein|nr:hypothetical protein [Treponema sp.]